MASMRRVSLARSTPFRLAALFSAVFVTIFVCSGILAIMLTQAQLAERLDLQVEQTFNITAGAYGTGDLGTSSPQSKAKSPHSIAPMIASSA